MERPATSSDQLISQTRCLPQSSTCPRLPACVAPVTEVETLSPAMFVATGAQPVAISVNSSLPWEAAVPASSGGSRHVSGSCEVGSIDGGSPPKVASIPVCLEHLPNEVLFCILGFLDVNDLLSTSRTSHLLRDISRAPILHHYRLRRAYLSLPCLLWSTSRPSLADLLARSIFLTRTTVVSKRLARSLVSIRLSRRLQARPTAASLVDRAVLPKECVPGMGLVHVAPGIVAKKKAIEKERVKDGLRQWIASKWKGQVQEREEGVRRWEESRGIGRVWRLRRFWERVSRGDDLTAVG